MARLINLRQIRQEKIWRGRTWFTDKMAKGEFPKPTIQGAGSGGHLWEEGVIDQWLQDFIAAEKKREAENQELNKARAQRATRRRDERAAAQDKVVRFTDPRGGA